MLGRSVNYNLDVDYYKFENKAGSEYILYYENTLAKNSNSLNPQIVTLLDYDGKEVWEESKSVGYPQKKNEISFELKDAGTYFLRIDV